MDPNTRRVALRRRDLLRAAATSSDLEVAIAKWNGLIDGETFENAEAASVASVEAIEDESEQLEDAFCKTMAFGTAGLRAKEGVGFNRMNSVTVALTSQGIASYILEEEGADADGGAPSVCIGFDGRKGSRAFAIAAASSFASSGLTVHLFDDLVPTPLLAFSTRKLGCRSGIMITASHNPKEYNGYKVYWRNGCQIVPPLDEGIAAAILEQKALNSRPADWNEETVRGMDRVASLSAEGEAERYCDAVGAALDLGSSRIDREDQVRIVYTPLHGVGSPYVSRVFDRLGLRPFVKVASQDEADQEFPTVSFPNPEEGAGVWTEAFKTADENMVDVCIANDPDADRLCCAERVQAGGASAQEWRIFSGNDLGIILGDWIHTNWKNDRKNGDGKPPAMLTTAVSARVLQSMCQQEGIHFEETLTGFKWLGNKALDLQAEGHEVLFAYEEAIGFMIGGTGVVDKDGVAAAAVLVDVINHVYGTKGITLWDHLEALYEKYGRRLFKQGYLVIDASVDTNVVFDGLRRDYPGRIGGLRVESVRDMGTGADTAMADGRTTLPWSQGDKMITFRFLDNGFCTIRASGTEPKLKYYIDLPTKDDNGDAINISAVEENIAKWISS